MARTGMWKLAVGIGLGLLAVENSPFPSLTVAAASAVQPGGVEMQSEKLLPEVRETLRRADSYAAVELIERQGEPSRLAELYPQLVMDLYWKAKDVPATLAVARAGIQYCLTKAREAGLDAKAAERFRGSAKSIAYNLASFTWPGWAEPGITLSPADVAAGFEAARLNLRLAVELKRGPGPLAAAHWMVGAHQLAAGRHAEAIEAFSRQEAMAREAKDRPNELLAQGFAGLTRLAGNLDAEAGARSLKEAQAKLLGEKVEDGQFFVDQLETARRVFLSATKT